MHTLKFIPVIAILLSLFLAATAGAQTPTPEWVNFYSSNSTLDGQPVPVGAVITAYDPSGVLCGRFTVTTAGSYGFMPCYLDDLNTPVDEGIRPGDVVRFKIDGFDAGQFQVPTTINNGDRFEVNLVAVSAPVPIPEPATLALLAAGLAGLAGYSRLRQRGGG
jgi:hypothetical protein